MRALLTNDDGIHSAGLRALAAVAVEAGLEVVVAAPHAERSGASASFSALQESGRLIVHDQAWDDVGVQRATGVEASPAFIVFAAAHGAFGAPPDLVLSGINHGPNTGQAVLHSGTVGAALTASTQRIGSLAVSMASSEPRHWDTARTVTARALDWLLEHPQDHVLNINVPDVPWAELRGLRDAPLASFGAVQADVNEVGTGFVTLTVSEIETDSEAGSEADTDADLLADGWATATVLRAPCAVPGVDLSALTLD